MIPTSSLEEWNHLWLVLNAVAATKQCNIYEEVNFGESFLAFGTEAIISRILSENVRIKILKELQFYLLFKWV
jgi:hypothetical protein